MDIPGVVRTTLNRWNRKRSKCKLFESLVIMTLYQQHFDGCQSIGRINGMVSLLPRFSNVGRQLLIYNFVNFSQIWTVRQNGVTSSHYGVSRNKISLEKYYSASKHLYFFCEIDINRVYCKRHLIHSFYFCNYLVKC